MRYTDNAINILTANTFRKIGPAWIAKNLSKRLEMDIIVDEISKTTDEKISEEIFKQRRRAIEDKVQQMESFCDGVVAIGDEKFPKFRGEVKDGDKPNVLFYKGDLSLLSLDSKNVAVIGVLNPNDGIEEDERKVVRALSRQGAVIVSGLALGCDTIAHSEAMRTLHKMNGSTHGATVAILPSPLGKIVPAQNREMAQYMAENGCLLITEYYEEPKSKMELSSRYVQRDRLQALFSDVVLLSASYTPNSIDPSSEKIDSGSRHAMDKAKDYKIKRAVIYHEKNKNNPQYDLNRQIKSEDETVVVINPEDENILLSDLIGIGGNKVSVDSQDSLF